jgi:hypothetical protein
VARLGARWGGWLVDSILSAENDVAYSAQLTKDD